MCSVLHTTTFFTSEWKTNTTSIVFLLFIACSSTVWLCLSHCMYFVKYQHQPAETRLLLLISDGAKKGFHSGPIMWVSHFRLWVAGPYNFPCCFGWVPFTLSMGIDFPIFLPIVLILVDLQHKYIFTQIFRV